MEDEDVTRMMNEVDQVLKQAALFGPSVNAFIDDTEKKWNSMSLDARYDLVERGHRDDVTDDEMVLLVRRHVCLLMCYFDSKPIPFMKCVATCYAEDVASVLIVESFRVMDYLSNNGFPSESIIADLKKEYPHG